jgi:apolipoprotein N-acyltransferase
MRRPLARASLALEFMQVSELNKAVSVGAGQPGWFVQQDDRLAQLTGWRAHGAAWLAGLLSTLSMAPFFWWPVLFATLPVLVWLLGGAPSPKRAAWIGWWFGFGYFLLGLFWIGEAFLVEIAFLWALPFAVTLLPAGLALFFAAATTVAVMLTPGSRGWPRIAALALTISAAEWLRGHILTGLPWNILGYALTAPDTMMQSASVLGIYGLTMLAVLVFAAPAVLWTTATRPMMRVSGVVLAVVGIFAMIGHGTITLRRASSEMVPGVKVRVVQPSILQTEKWLPENQRRIFNDHLDLSGRKPDGTQDGLVGINLVIWPEAAMPFQPLKSPEALAAIGDLLPVGTFLISGGLRTEDVPATGSGTDDGPSRKAFNSLMAFGNIDGKKGELVALYDKIHLVPFGEYLPFQRVLEKIGLRQLTRMRGGFSAHNGSRQQFVVPGLPAFGPLICYEAIFPAEVMPVGQRPAALINVTNDGWFGNTTGPRQHLHQTRVRAVEEGLPLVRAANNGISAVIDAHGRIIARLDMNVRGSLDSTLPVAAKATWYSWAGDTTFWVLWAMLAIVLLATTRVGRSATHRANLSN